MGERWRSLAQASRALLGGAALVLAGCAAQPELGEQAVGPGSQGNPLPSLLLVTVDTWRADRLPVYGSQRDTGPWLSAFARGATVYEQARAPASWTWPSMVSLVSGLDVRSHGAEAVDSALCAQAETLAERLGERGWATGLFGANEFLRPPQSGFHQGYEAVQVTARTDASDVLDRALAFADAHRGQPVFLHVHFFDPHAPYEPRRRSLEAVRAAPGPPSVQVRPGDPYAGPSAEGRCRTRDARGQGGAQATGEAPERRLLCLDHYDAELRELDEALAELQAGLEETGHWGDAWVVLTGDHGEEFGEHGRVGHGESAHLEAVHVPLLVRRPGGGEARRVGEPVSLVGLPRSVAGWLGIPPASSWSAALGHGPVRSESRLPDGRRVGSWEAGEQRLVVEAPVDGGPVRAKLYAAEDRAELLEVGDEPRRAALAAAWRAESKGQHAARVCPAPAAAHRDELLLRELGYVE